MTQIELLQNEKSLEELLNNDGTEADYDKYLDVIVDITRSLYKNYKFLRQVPSEDDYHSGNYLVFKFFQGEFPEEYDFLFRLAVDKGLEDKEINKRFVERLEKGEIIPLGDVEIYPSGTGISSLLQANDVSISITFETKERVKLRDLEREEKAKEVEEDKKLKEETKGVKREAFLALNKATKVLDILSDEVIEKNDLTQMFNKTASIYNMVMNDE